MQVRRLLLATLGAATLLVSANSRLHTSNAPVRRSFSAVMSLKRSACLLLEPIRTKANSSGPLLYCWR